MGANFGAGKKAARMEDEALRKQGISKEMVQMVTEVAQSLANAEDALKTAKESLKFELEDTLSLEAEANELYNMASAAVQSGDDDTARKHLTERRRVEAKMEDAQATSRRGQRESAEGRTERGIPGVAGKEAGERFKGEHGQRGGAQREGGGGQVPGRYDAFCDRTRAGRPAGEEVPGAGGPVTSRYVLYSSHVLRISSVITSTKVL